MSNNSSGSGVKFTAILLSIFVVNAAGILLKIYGFDAYLIFAGFRLYISLVVPFFIIFRMNQTAIIKQSLAHPKYNKAFRQAGWVVIPFIIVIAALFALKMIEIGDPDYFCEFGLSSIVDYPLYIIWNLPQLLLFGLYLIIILPALKNNVFYLFLVTASLFIFEFIPVNRVKPDILDIIPALLAFAISALIIRYFQNIYWFAIILFTMLWLNLLAFGSGSSTMIHMLFAARYQAWDGFFDLGKNIHQYLLTIQLAITFILVVLSALLTKNKTDIG